MSTIPDFPEDASEYHILGRVDDPESVARRVIEEAASGAVIIDLSAGQLNSPHQPHRNVPADLLESITWINGQHFAPKVGDASRNAYIKWLSKAADQPIAHGKSIQEWFTEENVRSIRPGHGLAPKYLDDLLGRRVAETVERETPLTWKLVVRSRSYWS